MWFHTFPRVETRIASHLHPSYSDPVRSLFNKSRNANLHRPMQSVSSRLICRMEKTVLTELLPRTLTEAEGPAFWFLNSLCVVKATTESTGGAFSLVHQIAP